MRLVPRVRRFDRARSLGPQLDPDDRAARRLLEAGAAKMLTGGTISLQSEGHPVEFRKVELRELKQ